MMYGGARLYMMGYDDVLRCVSVYYGVLRCMLVYYGVL